MSDTAASPTMFRYPPAFNQWIYLLLIPVNIVAWQHGYWWLTVLNWFVMAHLGHAVLLGFHEAVHYTLSKSLIINELRGFFTGTSIGVPLSVYRQLHKYHHANLSTPKDAELWPYNDPKQPLWFRRVSAFLEIVFGFFYTPLVFLRGTLADDKMSRGLAIRIAIEYALVVSFWAALLTMIAWNHWWELFLVGYLVPAMMAASLQTLRKFVEHMGLIGKTPLTLTRTVVDETTVGKVISASMLYVSYHGTHHRYGKLPYYDLPEATEKAYSSEPAPIPIYPSYWSAFCDMVPTLANPRCGSLWTEQEQTKRELATTAESN